MAFEDLKVNVSANTRDFERGISNAEESLGDLSSQSVSTAGTLEFLEDRADEAGDEIKRAGRSASTASGKFGALTSSSFGLSTSFGTLSAVTTVSLIPAIGALITAIAPLAATLTVATGGALALAGAFGAIVGSGILAFGQERGEQNRQQLQQVRARIEVLESLREEQGELTQAQQEELETLEDRASTLEEQTGIMGGLQSAFADLREEIQPLIVEFGQQFIPLIEDAIDAIPDLIRNIIDSVGGTDRFVSALRDLGNVLFNVIPELTAFAFNLAREVLPMAQELGGTLLDIVVPAWEAMREATETVGPGLIDLIDPLMDILGGLLEIGTVVLDALLGPLESLFEFIASGIDWFTSLNPELQRLIAIVTIATPVITALASVVATLLGPIGTLVTVVGGALVGGLSALMSALGGVVGMIGGPGMSVVGALIGGVGTLVSTIGGGLAAVLGGLIPVLGSATAATGGLAAIFERFDIDIDEIFGRIADAAVTMAESLIESFSEINVEDLMDRLVPLFESALQRLRMWMASGPGSNLLDQAIDALLQVLSTVPVSDIQDAIRRIADDYTNFLLNAFEGEAGNRFGDSLLSLLEGATGDINVSRIVGNFVDGTLDFLVTYMRSEAAQEAREEIGEAFGGLIRLALQDIVGGLQGDTSTLTGKLIDAVVSYLESDQAKSDLRTAFDVFSMILGDVISGLAQGLVGQEGTLSEVTNAALEWAGNAGKKALGNAFELAFSTAQTFITSTLPQLFVLGLGKALGVVRTVGRQILTTLTDVFNSLALNVDRIMTGIANRIIGVINNVIGRAQTLISQLPKQLQSQLPAGLQDISQLKEIQPGENIPQIQTPGITPQATQQRAVQEVAVALDIEATDNNLLAQFIQEEAELTVNEQNRRTRRTSGRNTRINR